MTERNAADYIRSRGIKGGEITLVKQLIADGKSDIEVDFALLAYKSDEVSQYLHETSSDEANFYDNIATAIDQAVKNGEPVPDKYIKQAKRLHKQSNFIKLGLKKIFPNL